MRNYLTDINIVGAVMVYQEGEQCRWSLDWLYENCDRVCILLDNWNRETEAVVMTYKEKYPDRTHISYSDEPVNVRTNTLAGLIKRRFKLTQNRIRERVIIELRKMHEEKPIDLLVWPDSDETFINQFTKILEEFWESGYEFMTLGFVEVFENMQTLINQKMGLHGRVYKYKPEMTANPYAPRTVYHPYEVKRPMRIRNVVVHLCHLTEEYRKKRQFFDNINYATDFPRVIWQLPTDVREMTVDEIADYQFGAHGRPSKYPPISLEEFLKNNK